MTTFVLIPSSPLPATAHCRAVTSRHRSFAVRARTLARNIFLNGRHGRAATAAPAPLGIISGKQTRENEREPTTSSSRAPITDVVSDSSAVLVVHKTPQSLPEFLSILVHLRDSCGWCYRILGGSPVAVNLILVISKIYKLSNCLYLSILR